MGWNAQKLNLLVLIATTSFTARSLTFCELLGELFCWLENMEMIMSVTLGEQHYPSGCSCSLQAISAFNTMSHLFNTRGFTREKQEMVGLIRLCYQLCLSYLDLVSRILIGWARGWHFWLLPSECYPQPEGDIADCYPLNVTRQWLRAGSKPATSRTPVLRTNRYATR